MIGRYIRCGRLPLSFLGTLGGVSVVPAVFAVVTFPAQIMTFAAPAVAHGTILWADANGLVTALAPPRYVP